MVETDWILYRGRTFQFHTHLQEVLAPLRNDIREFKWFLSDIDYMADSSDIPINLDQDYFILNKDEFESLLSHDIQFIWGSILGFYNESEISLNSEALPYVEGNDDIWKPGNIQIPGAAIEIDCFDSSGTIVKFSDENLSKKFHDFYPEFVPLSKFKRYLNQV
jgi:hypothetical protein